MRLREASMKKVLLVLGIVGVAMLSQGQTSAQRVPITATNVTETPAVIQYRGDVRIAVGNSVVVADEVDVPTVRFNRDGSANPIQLRGNVRMTFDTAVPVIIEHR
jgi:lipopolysaccharide export system protein LptA